MQAEANITEANTIEQQSFEKHIPKSSRSLPASFKAF